MRNAGEILFILKEKKKKFAEKYAVSELGLFGSYARGDNNEKSDIDILIGFDKPVDGYDFISIAHELEDLFQQKVDLVSRKGIKPAYFSSVEKDIIYV